MDRKPILLLLLLLLVSPCLPAAGPEVVAITGAVVVDGTGGPPMRATVLVRSGRIAAVGPDVAVPSGSRVIRAEGHTLLPGLFDIHTHLLASPSEEIAPDWGKILKSYLYAGVTTAVDVSTYGEQLEPMRRLVARGLPAPKLLLAVRFSTPGGHGAEGGRGDFHTLEVQTPAEARAAVRRILIYQPDILKVFTDGWRYGTGTDMTSMDQATLTALVDEAHKNGLKCLSHTVTLDKAKIASRAGVDAIIHGVGDAPIDEELIGLFREHKTGYAATLAVYEAHVLPEPPPPLLQELLPPAALRHLARVAPEPAAYRKRWQNLTSSIRTLSAAGLPLSCGTDSGMPGTFHGYATRREIELLVSAGLSPLQAITAATGNSARAIGVDGDRGTIAPGRAADLLLVEGAPHENIADLGRIARVFVNGREIDRARLRQAILAPEPTPIKARRVPALLEDFESADLRSRIGTLWLNHTDAGHDHTRMSYQRTLRKPRNHALTVLVQMSEKEGGFGSMVLPLSRGAIEPVDLSRYRGIQFEARGEGSYTLGVMRHPTAVAQPVALSFRALPKWQKVRLQFAGAYSDAVALQFRIARQAAQKAWLELDNIRLVR